MQQPDVKGTGSGNVRLLHWLHPDCKKHTCARCLVSCLAWTYLGLASTGIYISKSSEVDKQIFTTCWLLIVPISALFDPKKQGYGYSTSSAIYSSVRPAHPSSLIKQSPPSLPLRQNPVPADHQSIHEVAILHSANPSYWRFQANGTFEVNPPNIKPISRQDKPHQAANAALRNEKKCDSPDFAHSAYKGFTEPTNFVIQTCFSFCKEFYVQNGTVLRALRDLFVHTP